MSRKFIYELQNYERFKTLRKKQKFFEWWSLNPISFFSIYSFLLLASIFPTHLFLIGSAFSVVVIITFRVNHLVLGKFKEIDSLKYDSKVEYC